jgi:hypothetical protein
MRFAPILLRSLFLGMIALALAFTLVLFTAAHAEAPEHIAPPSIVGH